MTRPPATPEHRAAVIRKIAAQEALETARADDYSLPAEERDRLATAEEVDAALGRIATLARLALYAHPELAKGIGGYGGGDPVERALRVEFDPEGAQLKVWRLGFDAGPPLVTVPLAALGTVES